MCNGCSISGLKLCGGKGNEDIFRGFEELKDTLGKSKSVVQSLNSLTTAPEAEDSDVLQSGNENAPELRFSGIPKYKSSSTNEKIDRAIIFEHEE